ncbi:MAG TPA: DUF559 domain-containing protein [Mycobacteriales bacterium]|nr:DUF559 domain-containing protein [Mycobacteriales bacterium]
MPPRALVPDALRDRPFTRAQARAAGLTDKSLASSPWRQVFRTVWVHEDVADSRELRLAAARLVIPEYGVLCGLTAAWVLGVDVRREADLDVHVGFPKGRRIRKREGLQVCQESLDESDWCLVDGVRVTTPLRTAFDCLRWLPGGERIVVADALTHAELVSLDELRAYFASKRRLRNLRIGELLLDAVEPKSESPMETRTRLVLVGRGLPRPEAQWEICTPAGVFVARADLAYPELKVAVEYDGAWHSKQREADDRRRAAMRALGWDVLVYDADDVYGDPDRIVREVSAALSARRRALLSAT